MELEFTGSAVFEQLGLGLEIDGVKDPQPGKAWSVRKTFKLYRPDQLINWQVPKSILPDQHLVWF
jgi:hypothetical protein